MTQTPQGNNMFWSVQSAITVGSSAAGTNVSNYNVATLHLNGEGGTDVAMRLVLS